MLKAALEALGAEVEPMLARVRRGARYDSVRPRTHLLLRVTAEGAVWHADAGFGVGSLLEPIPFGPGQEYELSGWRVRVVEDGAELVLQEWEDGGWVDLYGFVPEPVPLADIATSNWYTCTHPRSPFVTGLIVAKHRDDGTRVSLSDWDNELSAPRADAVRDDHHARHARRDPWPAGDGLRPAGIRAGRRQDRAGGPARLAGS